MVSTRGIDSAFERRIESTRSQCRKSVAPCRQPTGSLHCLHRRRGCRCRWFTPSADSQTRKMKTSRAPGLPLCRSNPCQNNRSLQKFIPSRPKKQPRLFLLENVLSSAPLSPPTLTSPPLGHSAKVFNFTYSGPAMKNITETGSCRLHSKPQRTQYSCWAVVDVNMSLGPVQYSNTLQASHPLPSGYFCCVLTFAPPASCSSAPPLFCLQVYRRELAKVFVFRVFYRELAVQRVFTFFWDANNPPKRKRVCFEHGHRVKWRKDGWRKDSAHAPDMCGVVCGEQCCQQLCCSVCPGFIMRNYVRVLFVGMDLRRIIN